MWTCRLMFPLSRFFAAWFCPPFKRKPLGHPLGRAPVPWCSPSLRASWRSGCRVWHRTQGHLLTLQGENTESIAAEAVELWCTTAAGVVSGKSASPCGFVRACVLSGGALLHREAEHPCPAKGEADWANLASSPLVWMSQSVCAAAQRYKRCGAVSNITAASKSGCVCVFLKWCCVVSHTSRVNGTVLHHLGLLSQAFLFSWIVIPLMGGLVQLQIFCNYRRKEAVDFTRQLLVLPFEGRKLIRPRFPNCISTSVCWSSWTGHLDTVVSTSWLLLCW